MATTNVPDSPADRDRDGAAQANPADDARLSRAYCLLREPNPPTRAEFSVIELIYAVRAIGRAIEMHEGDVDFVAAMAGALKVIGSQLEDAIGEVDMRHEAAVRDALDALEQ